MKDRIGALDGWRGLAILLVLIDHAAELSHSSLLHKVTRVGATGVGIFFALSGFLITNLLLAQKEKLGHLNLPNFYTRRVFRIIPPVLVYLLTLALLRYWNYLQVTNHQLLSSIFLYRNYIPNVWNSGWYTGHFWSLMVEEHFYLFWPFLLILTRGNVIVLSTIALLDALWRAISFHYQIISVGWPPGRTDVRIDSLLWGCIMAIVLSNPKWRDLLKRRLTGVVILVLLGIDIVSNVIHGKHDYSFFEPIILALLLVWPILYPESKLRSVLDTPFFVSIGKISYSLYIWQQFWLLYPGAPKAFAHVQDFPLNIVMAFACATASYYLIETPFIKIGRHVSQSLWGQKKRVHA